MAPHTSFPLPPNNDPEYSRNSPKYPPEYLPRLEAGAVNLYTHSSLPHEISCLHWMTPWGGPFAPSPPPLLYELCGGRVRGTESTLQKEFAIQYKRATSRINLQSALWQAGCVGDSAALIPLSESCRSFH
ncbi:hypothetical protein LSTR_LSTR009875 [Laodelphax striatellus]|uniref:Uncharacterized protein n=1 Tax=Laodelphax striatellus TaxID=195883 RepID=A0A482WHQ8_LAOST|nr:hypothetical protein LSTR_LSTR009875 [Laodelphax striatellus]